MPSRVIALSKPNVFVVALPDGNIEITINGRDPEGNRIIQFELLPGHAQRIATDIVQALARLSGDVRRKL